MLIFDGVTKLYKNGIRALNDVSFAVGAGEFVLVEGHSGAGKTTIIKATIKEIGIDEGKIIFDSDDLSKIPKVNLPFLRRKIGVVFQDFKVLFDRTVAENIDLALDILGINSEIARKRRNELLELTGLAEKKNMFPVQLSGGELQRVAIARALSGEPKLLFADEPTGNLDVESGSTIVKLLSDIHEHGTTVVVATHDLSLFKHLGKRTIKMEKGVVIEDSGRKEHHAKT